MSKVIAVDWQRLNNWRQLLLEPEVEVDGKGNSDSDNDWLFGEGSSGVGAENTEGF